MPRTEHCDVEVAAEHGLVEHAVLYSGRTSLQQAARCLDDLAVTSTILDTEDVVGRYDKLHRRVRRRHQHRRLPLAVKGPQIPEPPGQAAGDRLEKNIDDTAATLPKRWTQREAPRRRNFLSANQPGSYMCALMFELTATDRPYRLAGSDDHLRAGFAWRRTADA
jgi:hypothetical protein